MGDRATSAAGWIERRSGPLAGLLIAGLLLLAYSNRFIQDDAFISFRYALNLAGGAGFVWNPGERVEGYSNFLWTLLVAAGMKLGAEPAAFTLPLGLALFGASLLLAWRLGIESGLGAVGALIALLLAGTNFTFSSYATGGLETPLVTALFLAACVVAALAMNGGLDRERGLLLLSALATAGLLTRMDAVILFTGPVLTVFVAGPSPGPGRRRRIAADLARLAVIPGVVVVGWLAWKYSYYGDIFPRAFYLKAVNASSMERGLRYFYAFIVSYNLAPFLFFCIFFFGAIFRREHRVQFMLFATALFWCAYVLKLGGDFMEFRMMAPLVPVMMILLIWLLFGCAPKMWLRVAGVLLILGGSVHHAATFSYDRETGVEPVGMLSGHLFSPGENWVGIGKALAAAFGPSDSVVIATTAAGAIPYYAGLPAVDMLGLNEPAAAGAFGENLEGTVGEDGADAAPFQGVFVSYVPGHQRVLPYEYLVRRGVNLVISHPIVTRVGEEPGVRPLLPVSGPPHLSAMVISMPIGGGYQVEMLYVRPNAAVDSALARRRWPARPVVF